SDVLRRQGLRWGAAARRKCNTCAKNVTSIEYHRSSSSKYVAPMCRSDLPADPVAQGLAHHQFEIFAAQPGQLLGEERDALFPAAGQARPVGAPKDAPRAEGVEDAPDVGMQIGKGVILGAVAGQCRGFHRDVR